MKLRDDGQSCATALDQSSVLIRPLCEGCLLLRNCAKLFHPCRMFVFGMRSSAAVNMLQCCASDVLRTATVPFEVLLHITVLNVVSYFSWCCEYNNRSIPHFHLNKPRKRKYCLVATNEFLKEWGRFSWYEFLKPIIWVLIWVRSWFQKATHYPLEFFQVVFPTYLQQQNCTLFLGNKSN